MSDSISFWILFVSAPAIVKRNDLQTILSFIEMTQHCSFPYSEQRRFIKEWLHLSHSSEHFRKHPKQVGQAVSSRSLNLSVIHVRQL